MMLAVRRMVGAVMAAPSRLWRTLREPRTISLLMVATYLVLLVLVWRVATTPGVVAVDVLVGLTALTIGCALGAPAAWRGWWGVEAPAAGLVLLGLMSLAVEDMARGVAAGHWPHYPALLTVALALMVSQRILRILGTDWEPGREPDTRARRAVTALTVARVVEADALAASAETRGRPGCDQI